MHCCWKSYLPLGLSCALMFVAVSPSFAEKVNSKAAISATFTNNGATNANSLKVSVAGGTITSDNATNFPGSMNVSSSMTTFTGGNLAPGNSSMVNAILSVGPSPFGATAPQFASAMFLDDKGNPLDTSPVPPVAFVVASSLTGNPELKLLVDNLGPNPLSYTGLELFTDARPSFFKPSTYVNGLFESGVILPPVAPPAGVFEPGDTLVAVIGGNPRPGEESLIKLPPPSYEGGVVNIDGVSLAAAAEVGSPSAVAEPSTCILALLALPAFIVFRQRRQALPARLAAQP